MDNVIFNYLTTIAIQIGAILFLLFGVRTLFKLYSYNMKMSAFYNAKADAIQLKVESDNIDDFKHASEIFSPLQINFDKIPEHPYKEFIDVAKKLILKNAGINSNVKSNGMKEKAKMDEE